ncbi:uncharacterized protein RSE6_00999 [Rhynchosporium secalis]|uniref:Dystroglycan-type cadherin-like domain-containing protein n=1 Tax=Rhynchosporium secalis TaxID=38038 RepID=A0A1E1LWN1_RHYSE|nr:uncharacterized protein RSE6_00999 [Rhynchosporium secalis]
MASRALIILFAIYGPSSNAAPTIAFPINSQVPPAARVLIPFSYAFPISTFQSDLPMIYTLSSGPTWLSLDSTSRILSGTPSLEDAGTHTVTGVPISLTASDSTGSITLNATLVVSKNSAPSVRIPASQLVSSGAFSAPSTLLYHPSTPFSFSLQPGTFANDDGGTAFNYYAITSDNTPLPSWIKFDRNSLSFAGQTPDYQSLIQPPQTFGIQLIASDIEGFGGSSLYFDVEVGVHLFAFKNAESVINGTIGERINFDGLLGDLELDSKPAKVSDLVAISANTPSWMTFNNSTFALIGTVPADAISSDIAVQVTDIYGDSADALVHVYITAPLFTKSIGDLNAMIGSTFSYDLGAYLTNKSDTILTAEIVPQQYSISFNPQTFILAGQISPSTQPSALVVTLSATSKTHQISDSRFFKLLLTADAMTTISTSARHSSIRSPSPTSKVPATSKTSEAEPSVAKSHKVLSTRVILAIAIPFGILFLGILLAFCCYFQRRHIAKKQKEFGKIEKRSISSPLDARPSVAESFHTLEPVPSIPPPPLLQLNMSGFGVQRGTRPGAFLGTISGAETSEKDRRGNVEVNNRARRSQTMSALVDPGMSRLMNSHISSLGYRVRSKSNNSLSDYSWSNTQESGYPTLRSSGTGSFQTHNLARRYSNYSRKGHTRHSTILLSSTPSDAARQSVPPSLPREESILNLQNSNFPLSSLDSFSALEKRGTFLDVNEDMPSVLPSKEVPIPTRSTKRQSKVTSTMNRPRDVGHSRAEPLFSSTCNTAKRRSIGHGQDWSESRNLARDSKTWLTIATSIENENRQSLAGASSTYEYRRPVSMSPRKTIRAVTKSPSVAPDSIILSESSGNSRLSRPVSRRVGSSPFFGGSSLRNSGKVTKKHLRTSYADSPTVPEEAIMDSLEETINRGLREMSDETDPRDSRSMSFGMAREGTRQLRSYIQTARMRTRSSIRSFESRDSRFDSAPGEMAQMANSPEKESRNNEGVWEDYSFSEGSLETSRSGREEESDMGRRGDAGIGTSISKSTPSSPDIDRATRAMDGVGRRLGIVDARDVRRLDTRRGVMDYTAYI